MPDASLIISFYNRIDFLKLILAGLERQSFENYEILIADDGSNREVIEELKSIARTYPRTIRHIWQEDIGFRKTKILNKAVMESSSDYLIFIDGDCIPHKEFVLEHFRNKIPNVCFTGRRVNLSEKITSNLSIEKIRSGYLEKNFLALAIDGFFGKSTDVEKGVYFKSKFMRSVFNKKKRGILGCNFSLFKEDFFRVNGFDERYIAPSIGEDTDIQYRLELAGTKIKSLNNIAIQYHLFHQYQERQAVNLELLAKVKSAGIFFTPYGINKDDIYSQ
ncbi:MAG: glycosyltransferase [bacterium]